MIKMEQEVFVQGVSTRKMDQFSEILGIKNWFFSQIGYSIGRTLAEELALFANPNECVDAGYVARVEDSASFALTSVL